MLSRARRLSSRDFSVAFEKGRVLRHPLMQVRIYRRLAESGENQNRETSERETRAAFVVPKKLGKAVWRNRVRRKVRERYRVLQLQREGQNELQNCNLIFFINASGETADTAQIDAALTQLLARAAKACGGETEEKAASKPIKVGY